MLASGRRRNRDGGRRTGEKFDPRAQTKPFRTWLERAAFLFWCWLECGQSKEHPNVCCVLLLQGLHRSCFWWTAIAKSECELRDSKDALCWVRFGNSPWDPILAILLNTALTEQKCEKKSQRRYTEVTAEVFDGLVEYFVVWDEGILRQWQN